jgi:glycine cleavage system H protein
VAVVNNCDLPEDVYYLVEKHVWARVDDGIVTVGITDVAQNLAKTFIACTPKKMGKAIAKGKSLATVESGKFVGPVPNPVTGEVVEINEAVVADPSLMNRSPYGEGWIVRVAASDWDADSADLVTGTEGVEAYRGFLDAEGLECT